MLLLPAIDNEIPEISRGKTYDSLIGSCYNWRIVMFLGRWKKATRQIVPLIVRQRILDSASGLRPLLNCRLYHWVHVSQQLLTMWLYYINTLICRIQCDIDFTWNTLRSINNFGPSCIDFSKCIISVSVNISNWLGSARLSTILFHHRQFCARGITGNNFASAKLV